MVVTSLLPTMAVPSTLRIQNLDECQNKEAVARKVTNELSRLSKRLKVMAVLITEDITKLPSSIQGYKAFETTINFDIDESKIVESVKKLYPDAECTSASVSGKTIGQVIREQREKILSRVIDI